MTAPTALATLGVLVIVAGLSYFGPRAFAREASDAREQFRGRQQVYLIAYGTQPDNAAAPIKIGIGKNPRERLAAFQTANPNKLVIVQTWTVPNARKIERAAHKKLQPYRLEGEWFAISPQDGIAVVNMEIGTPRNGIGPALRRAWVRVRLRMKRARTF